MSPDGTPSFLGSYRSWNAGGGEDGFLCVFGKACKQDVDDIAYVDDLLDLVADLLPVEADRIYATGLSNGAAISHRLACERAERFAGIAAIGGTNQAETAPGCDPVRPIPVLQVHGTEDPCWGYDGTAGSCAGDGANGDFLSVDDSMAGWASRLGCVGDPVETDLPDPADDGTTATLAEWPGCSARLARVRIEGGGHTWPGGWGWRDETKIGRVSQDIAGSDLVWDFLDGGR